MKITRHGTKDPIYKGVMYRSGKPLIFFGWSRGHVMRKAAEWLLLNEPVRPTLKLVKGARA